MQRERRRNDNKHVSRKFHVPVTHFLSRRCAYEARRHSLSAITSDENKSKERDNTMATKVVESERTAIAQEVTRQPDGPGRRIGKRGELTGIGKVTPDGARIFRERLPEFQAEAAYWENRIGSARLPRFPVR
jgi:hypothetical protein